VKAGDGPLRDWGLEYDQVQAAERLRMEVGETPAVYSVQAQHSKTGETVEEEFAGIKEAIARAASLIGAGYIVEIRSATTPA
jgi:hypothetical protein